MKYIKTEKEDLTFKEAIQYFFNGCIVRSYISECAYYINENDDIYTSHIGYCDENFYDFDFRMIKLDEEVWNSGEIQGKWNLLGEYKELFKD